MFSQDQPLYCQLTVVIRWLREWRGKGLHASYALFFFFSDGVCRSDLQLSSTFQIKAKKTYVLFVAIVLSPTKYTDSSWYFSTLFLLIFPRIMVFSRVKSSFNYWAELFHGTDEGKLQNYTHSQKINAVNTVKVTRLRKAVLLVVGRFIS